MKLVAEDPTLLTYFYLLCAGWDLDAIVETYEIDRLDAVRLNRKLDRLKLVEELPGDRVRIERADLTFQMLSVAGQNDYRSLRDKLGWSGSVPVARSPR